MKAKDLAQFATLAADLGYEIAAPSAAAPGIPGTAPATQVVRRDDGSVVEIETTSLVLTRNTLLKAAPAAE